MTFVWRTGRAMGRQLRDVRAVLFEGNHTLVRSVGRSHDAEACVVPAPRAVEAVAAVREAGLPLGVVSARQGSGAMKPAGAPQESVRALVREMFGHFDTWQHCGHAPMDRCSCRTPAPRLVLQAAQEMGVAGHSMAVISDNGPDMQAAQAAGAVGILVPTARTLRAERDQVPLVAPDLMSAVHAVLGLDRSWVPQD